MKRTRSLNAPESTLHLLHRAGQCAEELFERGGGDHGLTSRQFIVLALVADTEDPSQAMLCDKSGIDRSTLADIVRRLVTRGYLARRRTKRDARAYAVRITDAGRERLDMAMPVAREVEQTLLKGLAPGERQLLDSALRRIVGEIDTEAVAA